MSLAKNKETLGRDKCHAEIAVLHEVSADFAKAIESKSNEETIAEASKMILACNDVLYKKLISDCGFSFDEGEEFVQKLNLEALKAGKKSATQ